MKKFLLLPLAFFSATWAKTDCSQVEGMLPACVNYAAPAMVLKGDTLTFQCMDLIHNDSPEVRACATPTFVSIIVQTSETSEEASEGIVDEFFSAYPCEFVALYNKGKNDYQEQAAHLLALKFFADLDERIDASLSKFRSAVHSCKMPTKALESAVHTELDNMVKEHAESN